MENLSFRVYLVFIVSYLVHLPARYSILGAIRFDLILVALIGATLFFSKPKRTGEGLSLTSKILIVLWIDILVSIPFAAWPGTVIQAGIPNMIASAIFYYYTITLINSEKRLKIFILVFVACQSLRVFEPLYLHFTTGYWGDSTNMGGAKLLMMDRLAGAPTDTVNPNGLAAIICTIVPLYHFLGFQSSWKSKVVYLGAMPLLAYALVLTASRSGFLAFLVILIGILIKSKKKALMVGAMVVCGVIFVASLDPLQRDRYLSIGESDVAGSATVEGRMEGVVADFKAGMERPVFGSGLGTSKELNYHTRGIAMPSHNLYMETFEELGVIGLIILLTFMGTIISNFRFVVKTTSGLLDKKGYLSRLGNALQVWLWMNILFSFASYGLSTYSWYLFAGLSVVVRKLALEIPRQEEGAQAP
ncbi:MAG: O-antigen ligase family protein [Acidobacteriia bacterium]|nr:O-antigen ligase family protein [Terriglobia bacterium]